MFHEMTKKKGKKNETERRNKQSPPQQSLYVSLSLSSTINSSLSILNVILGTHSYKRTSM